MNDKQIENKISSRFLDFYKAYFDRIRQKKSVRRISARRRLVGNMLLRECTDKTEDLPIPTDVLSLFLSSLTPKMQDAAALKDYQVLRTRRFCKNHQF